MTRGKIKSTPLRWEYHWTDKAAFAGVPELAMLGFDRFQEASPLYDHRHERCYEFVYVENGKATWEVGESHYPSHAGQFFHTRPGEWHRAGFNFIEPCSIWWMIVVDPAVLPGWLGLQDADRSHIADSLRTLPRIVNGDARIREQFLKLRSLLEQGTADNAFRIRHHLFDLLLGLLYPPAARQLPVDLGEAMLALAADLQAEPERRRSNKELAATVGVSESHFYRLFQELHGQSPASYIDRLRMNLACELLRSPDASVTGVAMDLGYKTSQHFATVFKKYIGVSPTQWRSLPEAAVGKKRLRSSILDTLQ